MNNDTGEVGQLEIFQKNKHFWKWDAMQFMWDWGIKVTINLKGMLS